MNIPWSTPDIGLEERDAAQRVINSGWVSMGKETEEFQHELTRFIGCRDVVLFNNGTSALTAALLAYGGNDWRRTKHLPSYTFPATLNAVYASGGGQYEDFNIRDVQFMSTNPKTVQALTPKPTGRNMHDIYIPVSYAGLPLDRDSWGKLDVS